MPKSCIETQKLILYAQGISDPNEKGFIETHLSSCPLCMQRLTGTVQSLYHDDTLNEYPPFSANEAAYLTQFIQKFSEKNFFVEKIKKRIQSVKLIIKNQFKQLLIRGPRQFYWQGLEPQLIPYRSQLDSDTLEYFHHKEKINDVQMKFYFEKSGKNCFNMQISTLDTKQIPTIRVTLKQNNGSRISRLIGASGEWIKDVQLGAYLLNVEENSIQKGQLLLNVQPNMIFFDKKN